mmetsp:Transcript_17740/g.66996  ORF Transcript_17740/g.66996 Transcript_17740/m.66996 type:complete len:488 (-) Transcript_17740:4087-5550(-)
MRRSTLGSALDSHADASRTHPASRSRAASAAAASTPCASRSTLVRRMASAPCRLACLLISSFMRPRPSSRTPSRRAAWRSWAVAKSLRRASSSERASPVTSCSSAASGSLASPPSRPSASASSSCAPPAEAAAAAPTSAAWGVHAGTCTAGRPASARSLSAREASLTAAASAFLAASAVCVRSRASISCWSRSRSLLSVERMRLALSSASLSMRAPRALASCSSTSRLPRSSLPSRSKSSPLARVSPPKYQSVDSLMCGPSTASMRASREFRSSRVASMRRCRARESHRCARPAAAGTSGFMFSAPGGGPTSSFSTALASWSPDTGTLAASSLAWRSSCRVGSPRARRRWRSRIFVTYLTTCSSASGRGKAPCRRLRAASSHLVMTRPTGASRSTTNGSKSTSVEASLRPDSESVSDTSPGRVRRPSASRRAAFSACWRARSAASARSFSRTAYLALLRKNARQRWSLKGAAADSFSGGWSVSYSPM